MQLWVLAKIDRNLLGSLAKGGTPRQTNSPILFEVLVRLTNTLTALSLKFRRVKEDCTEELFNIVTRIPKLQHLALASGAVEWIGKNTTYPIDKGFTALTSLKLKAYVLAKPVLRTFGVLTRPCAQLQV